MQEIILVFLCMSSSVNAEEPCLYLGVDLASSLSAERKNKFDSTSTKVTYDAGIQSLYLGYCYPKNNRFLLSRTVINVDADGESDVYKGFDADWQLVYQYQQLMPYWSLGAGYYDMGDSNDFGDSSQSISGPAVNLSAGLKLSIHRNSEFDFSLRYKEIFWDSYETTSGKAKSSDQLIAVNVGAAVRF